ncbi:MAG TPA: shikimate kinase [Gemmataceae bacterium]|nr:shikimate kinase [Gemmataceae bacterium]
MSELHFLIGYRGSGKTTVGRALAARLGWDFLDADVSIESLAGKSILDIFKTEGETAFRDRESAVLADLARLTKTVVATGGGVVLRDQNRALLRAGFVTWLTASPEALAARIAADPTTATRRPNLTAAGGVQEVRALLAVREPYYRDAADFVVDAEQLSPEAAADAILAAWNGGSTCRSSCGPGSPSSSG